MKTPIAFGMGIVLLLASELFCQPIPVVLSTDVGNEIDDQWAIAYLLMSPELRVEGIMSAHAPSLQPPAAHTSFLLLKSVVESHLGLTVHPPLIEGSSLPLESRTAARESEAANFLVQISKSYSRDHRLKVLVIGAMTDVASAILKEPDLKNRIEILSMGFVGWPQGGDEFNIANDVKAMQVVLDSEIPVTVGSAEICKKHLSLTFDQAKQMMSERGPLGAWLWDEYAAWYYRYVKPLRKADFSKPWVIWDDIVIAHLLGMTTAKEYSRPSLRDDMIFEPNLNRSGKITWITGVDEHRMWADFLAKFDSYQLTHAVGSVVPR